METWPICFLKPANVGLPHLAPRNLQGPPSVTGVEQVLASRAMMWTATLDAIHLNTRDKILAYRAIALRRQGRLVPLLLPLAEGRRRPLPAGYTGPLAQIPWGDLTTFGDGTGWYQSAVTAKADAGVHGATQITIHLETGGTLEPGMLFSLGERLYEIMYIAAQSGNDWSVLFLPPLRQEHPDNTEVDFDTPHCRMRLASDNEMATTLELDKRSSPTVNWIEDPGTAPVITAGSLTPVLLWTPYDLGDKLRAWFHPDDYKIISGVAQWQDRKYGFMTQNATAAQQPSASGGFVYADGVDDFLNGAPLGANLPIGSSNRAIVHLLDQQSLPADATQRRITTYGATGAGTFVEILRGVVGGVNRYQNNADPNVNLSGVHICALVIRSGTQFRRVDGVQSASSSAGTVATGTTRYRHFCNISNTPAAFFLGGKAHEFVVADPTDQELQKLEGWIAWNRSLQSLLPSSHPYKTAPPTK